MEPVSLNVQGWNPTQTHYRRLVAHNDGGLAHAKNRTLLATAPGQFKPWRRNVVNLAQPHPDARVIDLSHQLIENHRDIYALSDRDVDAPGPDHDRHQALEAEKSALAAALVKAPQPTTQEGIQALAELAITVYADRTYWEQLRPPEDFGHWVWVRTVMSAAGMHEPIPMPDAMPNDPKFTA